MPPRSVEKEQFWRLVVEEHEKSGLTAREFCRNESISEPSFYSWRRKLRDRDADPPIKLVPVKIAKEHTPEPGSMNGGGLIEVITPDQVVLRVDESCSVDMISRVLAAVKRSAERPTAC